MNPVALAQTAVQILALLNVGIEEIRDIWNVIRSKNPELPELTTTEIAQMAEGKFDVLLDRIRSQQN